MASRVAISPTRAAALDRSRLPTFAHASSQTSNNPAARQRGRHQRLCRVSTAGWERNSVPVTTVPRAALPENDRKPEVRTASCARASACVVPGESRATRSTQHASAS